MTSRGQAIVGDGVDGHEHFIPHPRHPVDNSRPANWPAGLSAFNQTASGDDRSGFNTCLSMDPFDPAHPRKPLLEAVPVRQRVYDDPDPHQLVDSLSKVGEILGEFGAYVLAEMPAAVRYVNDIALYYVQVTNGGHEQFVRNCGWSPALQQGLDEALGGIGAIQYQAVFRDTARYINETEARTEAVRARGGFDHPVHGPVDEWIRRQDTAFLTLNREQSIIALLHAWLLRQPSIQPVADLQWKFDMAALIEANPLRDARLAQWNKRKRDFVAELRAGAPMKKTYHEYACELARQHGITLPWLGAGSWEEVINGEECRVAHYVDGTRQYAVIFGTVTRTAVMFLLKKKLFGKGMKLGRRLGDLRLEFEEV